MKFNHTLFFACIASVVSINAYAVTSTVTSKDYVDTEVGKKQNTIPVAGTNTANPGTSVVMYTATAGTVGERGIYSGGTYTAGTDANKLVTAAALKYTMNNIPTMTTSNM